MRWYEKSWVNGCWIKGQGSIIESVDLSTQEPLYRANCLNVQQINQQLDVLDYSQKEWAATSIDHRIKFIHAFKEQLEVHKDLIARAISQEVGKPLWEAKTEVAAMLGKVDLSIKASHERCPLVKGDLNGISLSLKHKPHGLVYIVAPFNFPAHLPNGHIIPALLAGNTIVYKPSEFTPRCGELVARLWEMSNIPQGVFNFILADTEGSKTIVESPCVQGVFFTGSDTVGRIIEKNIVNEHHKILALELGGNNPLIISSYKDQSACIQLVLESAFLTAGQRCTCARRLIVINTPENRKLVDRLVAAASKLSVGAYSDDPEPFCGPLIHEKAKDDFLEEQDVLEKEGASILLKAVPVPGLKSGLTPAIIDVTAIKREDKELFGPILQLIWVKDYDEGIEVANQTKYGLCASVVTQDDDQWQQAQHNLNVGVLNRNRPTNGASGALPFGGAQQSGNFRPSGYWAADYCSYPQAQMSIENCMESSIPGLKELVNDE